MKSLGNGTWWAPRASVLLTVVFVWHAVTEDASALTSMHFSVFCQKCAAYTCNNLRKRTPAPDKKSQNVRPPAPFLFLPVIFLYNGFNWTLLSCFPVAFCGGFSKCVSDLPWGDPAPVSEETGKTRNFEKWQNWSVCYRNRNRDRDVLILFSDTMMLDAFS